MRSRFGGGVGGEVFRGYFGGGVELVVVDVCLDVRREVWVRDKYLGVVVI